LIQQKSSKHGGSASNSRSHQEKSPSTSSSPSASEAGTAEAMFQYPVSFK